MVVYAFLVTLTFTTPALAGSAWERPAVQQAHAELEEAEKAAETLPPCTGIQRLWDAAAAHATPASCPKTRQFWQVIEKAHDEIARSCRELETLMADVNPTDYCGAFGNKGMKADLMRSIWDLKVRTQRNAYGPEGEIPDIGLIESAGDLDLGTGEYVNESCVVGANISLWVRKKENGMLLHHFGYADEAVDQLCDPGSRSLERYRLFQAGREDEAKKLPR